MKKIIASVLALTLSLALGITAFAADSTDGTQNDEMKTSSRTVLTYDASSKEETKQQLDLPQAKNQVSEVSAVRPSKSRESAVSDPKAVDHLKRVGVVDENGIFNMKSLENIPFNPLDEDSSSRAVIGTDYREEVLDTEWYPYSCIGYLITTYPNGETFRGTAFTMGPYVAATAAHCLYNDSRGGWAADVSFIPARAGSYEPVGEFYFDTAHIGGNYPGDNNDDWGMIEFTSNVGDIVGYMGMQRLSSVDIGATATVTGYPSTVRDMSNQRVMYTDTESVDRIANMHVYYDTDTSGGNSGGPVHDGDVAIAIHSKGSASGNHGKGFDDWLFDFFLQYR